MLKALSAVIVVATSFSAAQAYKSPMPGDLALDLKMCNDVCDTQLKADDNMRMACHDLCQDMEKCRADMSQNENDLMDCVANANRAYSMRMQGANPRQAAMAADGDKSVVTDVDNSRYYGGEDDSKGFSDHD